MGVLQRIGVCYLFAGLIVASVIYILKTLEKVNLKMVLLMVLGTSVSFLLSIRSNPVSNDSFGYLFLCASVLRRPVFIYAFHVFSLFFRFAS